MQEAVQSLVSGVTGQITSFAPILLGVVTAFAGIRVVPRLINTFL